MNTISNDTASYLWNKLTPTIQDALVDENIFEITLNPDGNVWLTHKDQGCVLAGKVPATLAHAFANGVAARENKYLNSKKPYLDALLPFSGERICITTAPLHDNIAFNIRKKANYLYTLENYVATKVMTRHQQQLLCDAITARKNILVSGSPGSGKTTLTNALLGQVAKTVANGHRILLLEQIPELQCRVKNVKAMQVSDTVPMNKLLWIAMRNSPDRIIIGEVRDGAALDMLKAWNTGCPGGIATIHANNSIAAIQRVLDLSCEAIAQPPYTLASEALDLIVQINADNKHPAGRRVTEIIEVTGFDRTRKLFQTKQLDQGENHEEK